MNFIYFKPYVSPKWLIIIAGVFWSVVGISLLNAAYHWTVLLPNQQPALWLGISGAIPAAHFIFAKIASRNIVRLLQFPGKKCLFGFQSWKSYLNIIFMIALGNFLRHSLFPKSYLTVIYTVVGGGLFLASLKYYAWLWTALKDNPY